jgi:hypothetical protein
MHKELRLQARMAFDGVRDSLVRYSVSQNFNKLVDLNSALEELGQAVGCPVGLEPSRDAYCDKWDVISHEDPGSRTIVAGISLVTHSDKNFDVYTEDIMFHPNPSDPSNALPLVGNEVALFKRVIQHLQSVTKTNVWERDCVPALDRLLSGPQAS